MLALTLYWLCRFYLLVLLVRVLLSWVPMFSPGWQPRGFVLVLVEGVYWLTDPPINWLRRYLKPIRIGNIALDLGILLLFLAVQFAASATRYIPF